MNKNQRIILISGILLIILLHSVKADDFTINIDIPEDVEEGEEFSIMVDIQSTNKTITKVDIDYDDGKIVTMDLDGAWFIYQDDYIYKEDGIYDFEVTVNGDTSKSETITVENAEPPDEKPTLEISYPLENQTIEGKRIEFKFTPDDDKKISHCDLQIYWKEPTNDKKEYSQKIENPPLGQQQSIGLNDFENKEYYVKIICTDNNTQEVSKRIDFKVQTEAHENEEEILNLIDQINNLTEKKSDMPEEKSKILDKLKIMGNLKYSKQRLMKINEELSKSGGISNQQTNEKEKQEFLDEFETIQKQTPINIEILETKEYMINTVPENFEEILKSYLKDTKKNLNTFEEKMLIEKNQEIQTKASTSVEIIKIKIEHESSSKIISIIKKEIKLNDETIKQIIEYFPEKGDNFNFTTPGNKLNKNIYEIEVNSLEEDSLIYYIEEDINIEDIKKTQTVIYKDFQISSLNLIGFATYDVTIKGNSKYFSLIILLVLSGLFVWKGKTITQIKLKKSPTLKEMKKSLNKGLESAKKEDLFTAKDKYNEIRESYKSLSSQAKKSVYPKIEKLRIEIDKREMRDFIKEYKKIKREGNKIEAQELFEEIKKKYTRLPKKFQQTIYQKVIASGP